MRYILILSFIIMATISDCAKAKADLIVDTTVGSTQTELVYLYVYTIADTSSSTSVLQGFSFEVDASANISPMSAPGNWDFLYFPSDRTRRNYIVAWEVASLDDVVYPGSAATFSFTSQLPPGTQEFTVSGIDLNTYEGDSKNLKLVGPATSGQIPTVPTPSGLILVIVALATIIPWLYCQL
jgi:hypothetical protein